MTTHPCISCDSQKGMKRFENETFVVEHAGMSTKVDGLSGWRCGACDEIEFDPASALRYAEAGDKLVLRAREHEQAELRRIRKKLGLTQQKAAVLTGGGHNAFSRYERGEAPALSAVVNLFKLLDRHPELLGELQRDMKSRVVGARRSRERHRPLVRKASLQDA